MRTLDVSEVMAKRRLSNAEAREWMRRRLKTGHFWSRMNPDLLCGDEVLPYVDVDKPPQSPATLIPFPVSAGRHKEMNPADPDYLEKLARVKIRWCRAEDKAGPAVYRRVIKQLAYYSQTPTSAGEHYRWFGLNPQLSPLWPLAHMIFPALDNYRLPEPVLPEPSQDRLGEAWQSGRDDYGVTLRFSVRQQREGSFVLAAALLGAKTYWLGNYLLSRDRYSFIRQQLFYLLGERMDPWHSNQTPQNSFRGLVYRKPKSIKKDPQ